MTHLTEDEHLLERALRAARDTRRLHIDRGARRDAAGLFAELFGSSPGLLIADENTFAAAGRDVYDAFRTAGQPLAAPVVLPGDVYAEYPVVSQLCAAIGSGAATPVAVGSGTINDLVKRAAHECSRPYMVVATAASMDGYTAFGASLTHHGSKQTFDCSAPRAVVADLDVISQAPAGMNAAGYADVLAKCPAGADWILADAVGVERIEPEIWNTVQSRLRFWLANPAGVRHSEPAALRRLTMALAMTGFAMQAACSSRPASGAEHQFSHLWDMEHHTHHGTAPSHGFKVGIGSLASIALYEAILAMDWESLETEGVVADWPDSAANEREIASLFDLPELLEKAREESAAKHVSREKLQVQLESLRRTWPTLRRRLSEQLIPLDEARDMLSAAGCPTASEEIGISRSRLKVSYHRAYHIRRRFTVLDLARRTGLLDRALSRIFLEPRQETFL